MHISQVNRYVTISMGTMQLNLMQFVRDGFFAIGAKEIVMVGIDILVSPFSVTLRTMNKQERDSYGGWHPIHRYSIYYKIVIPNSYIIYIVDGCNSSCKGVLPSH